MPRTTKRQRKQPTNAQIESFFHQAGFYPGDYYTHRFKNEGYRIKNDDGEVIDHQPFKRFDRKKRDKMGKFGFDFNAKTRLNGKPVWFQIVAYGSDTNEWMDSGFWYDGVENAWIEQAIPAVDDVIEVTGKFELREVKLDKGNTIAPQLVIFHPEDLKVQSIEKRPLRPDLAAARKARNAKNKAKNRREVTKAKAKTGVSVKTAQGLDPNEVF